MVSLLPLQLKLLRETLSLKLILLEKNAGLEALVVFPEPYGTYIALVWILVVRLVATDGYSDELRLVPIEV